MSRNYVITVRLPKALGLGIERLAARTGHKPAYLGAVAVDEFMRRRTFPLIDIRDTSAGRVAYVKGTRLAVYWLVDAVRRQRGGLAKTARIWAVSPEKIRAALHYAQTYPNEMKALRGHGEENRAVLQTAEAAFVGAKVPAKRNGSRQRKPRAGR